DRLVVAAGVGAAAGRVPAVVRPRLDQVDLVVLVGAVLDGPDLVGAGPDGDALDVAVAVGQDRRAGERVARCGVAGVEVDMQDLAAEAVAVLGDARVGGGIAGADEQGAVRGEGWAAAGVPAAGVDRQAGEQLGEPGGDLLVVGQPPGHQADVRGFAVLG